MGPITTLGWECRRCTYRHHAPRFCCVMCGELRVNKEQMRDFISGKTIRKNDPPLRAPHESHHENNQNTASTATKTTTKTTADHDAPTVPTVNNSVAPSVRNPYAHKIVALRPLSHIQSQKDTATKGIIATPGASTNEEFDISYTKNMDTYDPSFKRLPPTASSFFESKKSCAFPTQRKTQQLRKPYHPGPVPLQYDVADTWIYPIVESFPKRQYQFDIAHQAILQNTLVSLPTGLGKTLIAAVVLYNYYRWFPTGKVIFLAPTLPLVDQQVQACYEIMGIPATDTALLTGKVAAQRRAVVWEQRRVFFCTPQTVQRDLENSRLNASRVVCVVLDEAHKSTGDYAYCKVIELLHQAGAKFRTVGLSATPGTSIQAIQQVVNVLRINRIEARNDADPDVKQYIHERQTEVIVVKQVAASKQIERLLDEVIGPILDRLRAMGGIPSRMTGNATVTCYCLIKSREEFTKRDGNNVNGSMYGYFAAGITFLQVRADLHNHGIGIVRGKLQKLQTDRVTGYTATVVKSKAFQLLWEEVNKASCDPSRAGNTIDDKLRNNPKLSKLREILTEHFERARACGTSSRAIVFSQFRDSVTEIVDVLRTLRPLVLAKAFVGQGKSSSTAVDGTGQTSVKGMTQDEQKRVIQEFRKNLHNTLVCTCIGEEGLDIGEVDIILNFDCLSSPIRMLQRVGRTGRKRAGRVVSLVAQGPEERTLAKSRQNERNLVHALKNPKSFTVTAMEPMFPKDPLVCERNMKISKHFQMSQIEGARKRLKRLSSSGLSSKRVLGLSEWKLNTLQESRRVRVFGTSAELRILNISADCSPGFPALLRRRFLSALPVSLLRHDFAIRKVHYPFLGRVSQMLRTFEISFASSTSCVKPNRKVRSRQPMLDDVFPINSRYRNLQEETAVILEDPDNFPSTSCHPDETNLQDISTEVNHHNPSSPLAVRDRVSSPIASLDLNVAPMLSKHQSAYFVGTRQKLPLDRTVKLVLPVGSSQYSVAKSEEMSMGPKPHGKTSIKCPEGVTANKSDSQKSALDFDSGAPILCSNVESYVESRTNPDADVFRLPSPGVSSESSDDELDVKANSYLLPFLPNKPDRDHVLLCADIRSTESIVDAPFDDEVSFRLPTPNSSSGESEDDMDNNIILPLPSSPAQQQSVATQQTPVNLKVDRLQSSARQSSAETNVHWDNTPKLLEVLDVHDDRDTQESEALHRRKNSSKRAFALMDTPETECLDFMLPSTKASPPCEDLSNTQDDCENIACLICMKRESSENNPIILCDGPGNNAICNVAVHVSCYSATVDLQNDSSEWWCDRCSFLRSGGAFEQVRCSTCNGVDGALKRMNFDHWNHIICHPIKCRLKRIRPSQKKICTIPDKPLLSTSRNDNVNEEERKNRRQELFRLFIDDEADVETDHSDGDEIEEVDVRALEEEEKEFARNFINDSSELGYTQDVLDIVDPCDAHDTSSYRMFNLERENERLFATPALNRRVLRRQQEHRQENDPGHSSDESPLVPESERGLGKMHFIRSVLEHHRNGGQAEEIEEAYNRLEKDADSSHEIDCT